ncbi:MAG: sterol desaturase family protein [Kiloniellales bacterium]
MASSERAERSVHSSVQGSASRIGEAKAVRLALGLLAALFAVRVLLQFLQSLSAVAFLPAAADWDSGLFSYGWLLTTQLVLLAAMVQLIRTVDGRARPVPGLLLSLAGAVYFAAMALRAGLGASGLMGDSWYQAPLSTSFHLVLAGFLVILGLHWRRAGARSTEGFIAASVRRLLYPATLCGGLLFFVWSLDSGVAAPFAAYHAVLLGGGVVVIAELLLPYRGSWQPRGRDLSGDLFYLFGVQVALPAGLSAALLLLAAELPSSGLDLWPQAWPLAAQVLLLLLLADLARYWLHRASHAQPLLWRLHAVHYAPQGLHALNVGRFHPLEKLLQFGVDSLPFLLLGAAPEVLAAYLVFYAINGFLQHCNVDLRLGWLNWIVSGPELHRWHHARRPALSDHNFGNNLILWDLVFGTRWLPRGAAVGALGLRNPAYPRDLLGQTLAPFLVDPNHGGAK